METQILTLLQRRLATRAIAERPVEPEKIQALVEAARLSASCANNQPWRFLVLTSDDPLALAKGRQALSAGNYWAVRAPVLIFGYSWPELDCVIPDGRRYYLFDLGLAVQNILLQAAEFGLVARPMAGYSPQRVKEAFELPEPCEVGIAIAVGYEGDISTLNERHQAISRAPRQRKPLEEIAGFNRPPAA